MKSAGDPLFAGGLDKGFFLLLIIEIQSVTGSSSDRGCSDQVNAVGGPTEMFCPKVLAGVKDRFLFFRDWIDPSGEVVAFFVTATASKGQILEGITATQGLGPGMFN